MEGLSGVVIKETTKITVHDDKCAEMFPIKLVRGSVHIARVSVEITRIH